MAKSHLMNRISIGPMGVLRCSVLGVDRVLLRDRAVSVARVDVVAVADAGQVVLVVHLRVAAISRLHVFDVGRSRASCAAFVCVL